MWTQTGTGTPPPVAGARTPGAALRIGAELGPRRDGVAIRGEPGLRPGCGGRAMTVTTTRWQVVRDLAGGSLLLAAWLLLWTVTWAAVAGPLSPATRPAARAEVAETARAGVATTTGPTAAP